VEDCNLIFYIIDSRAPERARLDIFEQINGGEPLTLQQMRNSLYNGKATEFLTHKAIACIGMAEMRSYCLGTIELWGCARCLP